MKKPTVDLFTFCYNEEVMMPYFLKHYAAFCENIYIYDNYSNDNSVKIASEFPNTHIRCFDTNNEIRDDILLELKNNCWKDSNADLIIVCDIDEFLYHKNMIRFLKRFKSVGYSIARPCAYDMFNSEVPTTEGHIYDEVKIANRNVFFDKLVLFDPQKIKDTNYYPGAHYALPEGEVKLYKDDHSLKLLHFKYLGVDHIMKRHELYRKRLSEINKNNNWGYEYDVEYESKIKSYIEKSLKEGILIELE